MELNIPSPKKKPKVETQTEELKIEPSLDIKVENEQLKQSTTTLIEQIGSPNHSSVSNIVLDESNEQVIFDKDSKESEYNFIRGDQVQNWHEVIDLQQEYEQFIDDVKDASIR